MSRGRGVVHQRENLLHQVGQLGEHDVGWGVPKRATSELESEVKASPSAHMWHGLDLLPGSVAGFMKRFAAEILLYFCERGSENTNGSFLSCVLVLDNCKIVAVNHHGESPCLTCGCKEPRISYEWHTTQCLYQV